MNYVNKFSYKCERLFPDSPKNTDPLRLKRIKFVWETVKSSPHLRVETTYADEELSVEGTAQGITFGGGRF